MFEGIPDQTCSDNEPAYGKLAIALGGLLFVVVIFVVFNFGSPKQVPWAVADGNLQIHARFIWSEDYPVCNLEIGQAQVLDLQRDPGWLPGKKIWGFDGSNYNAGNFILRNGKKVELALAKETIAVLIPRFADEPVMVGVNSPDKLLGALRAASRGCEGLRPQVGSLFTSPARVLEHRSVTIKNLPVSDILRGI